MRRAAPHELTVEAVPVITARVSEAELAKWLPIAFDAIDDPLQAPEPSLGALAELEAGGYVVLNYGKDSKQLTVELPATTKDPSALLAAFFEEVPLPTSRVLWHRRGTRLPQRRGAAHSKRQPMRPDTTKKTARRSALRVTTGPNSPTDRRARFDRNVLALQNYAQDRACPVYAIDDTYGALEGSSFLLDVAASTLLVTAAHVLYIRHEHHLYIPGDHKPESFGGKALYTGTKEYVSDPDYGWDMAVVRLSDDSVARCSGCRHVRADELAVDDFPQPQTLYGFTGFPADVNLTGPDHSLPRYAHYYGGQPVGHDVYQQLNIHPETHFLMTFDQAAMVDQRGNVVSVPEPHGMSGGPVWRLGSFPHVEWGTAKPQVIGLAIWWYPALKILTALRMSLVVSAIANAFPDLADHLPRPAYVGAQVTLQ